MQSEGRQAHWETVYTKKGENQVSWFQDTPTLSLDLIAKVGATPASAIIDVGGGASRLVDNLVNRGFENVTVLDLSEAALEDAKSRLGSRAAQVRWIVADVTVWEPEKTYEIWHDRAAFHFLTEEREPEVLFGVGSDVRSASKLDPIPRAVTHCINRLIVSPTRVTVGSRLGVKSRAVSQSSSSHTIS
jgi:trans-aconitate methyltransferase